CYLSLSLQPSHTPHLEGSITSHITETTTPLAVPTPSTLFPTRPLESGGVGVSTELGVKNFPPRVEKRIQKMAWVAGHLYKLPIPRDTFKDMEDGDTRSLRLVLKNSHGHPIGSNSWIQFNQEQQLIYALPLERDIGRYTYLLEALDSENKSATDTVMIHVQQPQRGRNFNHRFTATFILQKEYEFNSSLRTLDWKVKAVEKIAEVYGDPNAELINVRSISTNPKKLVWTNTSLSDPRHTQGCPKEELDVLADVVVGSGGHGASREAKRAFEPEFNLKQVHLHLLGNCQADHRPHRPVVPTRVPEVHEGVTVAVNIPPIIRNQIDILNTTEGALFRYKVPQDTCYDTEDGASSRLKLRLLTSNLSPPANTSWLQFDPSNQEFFGIPQSSDVGKAEYILECVDKGGAKANDALFVTVLRRESRKIPSAEFSLTLSDKFSDFLQRPHRKAKLVERIAGAFGDDHPRHVSIKSFTMGSVVVAWHNNSLPSEPCPNREIRRLARTMVTENGELKPEFIEYFRPEFNVLGGSVTPSGTCLAEGTTTHPDTDHTHHQPPPEQEIVGQNEENDYLLNFIIPAVIIALMLLLAAVIACCLYRRRRYGKMRMADDRTYVSKGIPIIFAEELDDRPDPAKSPVIMKEEKPPLPPPEYQRGTSPATTNHPTPPPTAGRRRPHSGGDVADDAPSYQPPPPFTATNGASRHPRPNMPPTYRKPPTYPPLHTTPTTTPHVKVTTTPHITATITPHTTATTTPHVKVTTTLHTTPTITPHIKVTTTLHTTATTTLHTTATTTPHVKVTTTLHTTATITPHVKVTTTLHTTATTTPHVKVTTTLHTTATITPHVKVTTTLHTTATTTPHTTATTTSHVKVTTTLHTTATTTPHVKVTTTLHTTATTTPHVKVTTTLHTTATTTPHVKVTTTLHTTATTTPHVKVTTTLHTTATTTSHVKVTTTLHTTATTTPHVKVTTTLHTTATTTSHVKVTTTLHTTATTTPHTTATTTPHVKVTTTLHTTATITPHVKVTTTLHTTATTTLHTTATTTSHVKVTTTLHTTATTTSHVKVTTTPHTTATTTSHVKVTTTLHTTATTTPHVKSTTKSTYPLHYKIHLSTPLQNPPIHSTTKSTYPLHYKIHLSTPLQNPPIHSTTKSTYPLHYKIHLSTPLQNPLIYSTTKSTYPLHYKIHLSTPLQNPPIHSTTKSTYPLHYKIHLSTPLQNPPIHSTTKST
ncbi:hypothetical protein Pmani_036095, partial [Petrolisthes manimaculis]